MLSASGRQSQTAPQLKTRLFPSTLTCRSERCQATRPSVTGTGLLGISQLHEDEELESEDESLLESEELESMLESEDESLLESEDESLELESDDESLDELLLIPQAYLDWR